MPAVGYKHTPESRAKMRGRRRPRTPEQRALMKTTHASAIARTRSDPAVNQRRVAGIRAAHALPEYREAARKKFSDPSLEKKRIEGVRRFTRSPEASMQRSAFMKAAWARKSPAEREVWILSSTLKAAKASRAGRRSSLEIRVEEWLLLLGEAFIAQHVLGRFVVDFFIPSVGLAIECDGEYWHSFPEAIIQDAKKNAWLVKHGWAVLRLPERNIKNGDAFNAIKSAIV